MTIWQLSGVLILPLPLFPRTLRPGRSPKDPPDGQVSRGPSGRAGLPRTLRTSRYPEDIAGTDEYPSLQYRPDDHGRRETVLAVGAVHHVDRDAVRVARVDRPHHRKRPRRAHRPAFGHPVGGRQATDHRRLVPLPRRRRDWALGTGGAAMSYGAYGVSIWAMTLAPIAVVAALRETSILFAVLIGWLLFGERMDGPKWVAVALIVTGVALTRL